MSGFQAADAAVLLFTVITVVICKTISDIDR